MIYTVTLNPSLDYVVDVKSFRAGTVNRSVGESIQPGGKGINVSLMLGALGCESAATGFLAGFTGEEIRRLLLQRGVSERFFFLKNGFSRINVKLRNGEETEINGAGPSVSEAEKEALLGWLEQTLADGDTLVLSGSVPRALPADIYVEIIRRTCDKGVRIAADVSGSLLRGILPHRPFLVKPNHHELGELFGCEIASREEAAFYAHKLCGMGARNALVSLAGDGAVLVTEKAVYFAEAPKGVPVNSVGAGDSAVAGFLAGWKDGEEPSEALRLAVAAGSATAFSEGIATADEVSSLQEKVSVVRKQN
ncbi:MAG: 1-phosphofructokinase [Clostridia bacterium]|nr:1-phosphofructokinase [Clostridia bacterium]